MKPISVQSRSRTVTRIRGDEPVSRTRTMSRERGSPAERDRGRARETLE